VKGTCAVKQTKLNPTQHCEAAHSEGARRPHRGESVYTACGLSVSANTGLITSELVWVGETHDTLFFLACSMA